MNDLDTLARTLYGEAEAHDAADAIAISHVVANRVAYPNWPNSVAAVCMQPWQFSCWNAGNPRREKLISTLRRDSPWLDECYKIAANALSGMSKDPTNGATHYYASYLKAAPKWAKGKVPCYQDIGGKYHHLYFNNIDTPPPETAKEALDQERPISESRTIKAGTLASVTGITAVAAGVAEQIAPALPALDWIKENVGFALIVIGIAVAIFAGVTLYARIDDRRKGLR